MPTGLCRGVEIAFVRVAGEALDADDSYGFTVRLPDGWHSTTPPTLTTAAAPKARGPPQFRG